MKNYAKNIRTVPRMNARQMGQFRNDGAQLLQQDKWPQGKNTTLTSTSMQTLQVFASFNCRFSSIKLLASEEKQNHNIMYNIITYYSNKQNIKYQRCSTRYSYLYSSTTRVQIWSTRTRTRTRGLGTRTRTRSRGTCILFIYISWTIIWCYWY